MIALALRFLLSPCLLGHSNEWTRVIVAGVWMRACSRCQQPLTALLADRGKALEDIQPAKVPPILERHAQRLKVKRPRKAPQQLPKLRQVK